MSERGGGSHGVSSNLSQLTIVTFQVSKPAQFNLCYSAMSFHWVQNKL